MNRAFALALLLAFSAAANATWFRPRAEQVAHVALPKPDAQSWNQPRRVAQ